MAYYGDHVELSDGEDDYVNKKVITEFLPEFFCQH
jgi:hypothetical protein